MPVILLVRHGETDAMRRGLSGRLAGVHLNEKGRDQAVELVERMKNLSIQAIHASPLERTLETADPLAVAQGLPIFPQPGLLEVDYGRWTGRTFKQLQRIKAWQELHIKPSTVQFPEGENFESVQQRVVQVLWQINEAYSKKEMIVCFTHGDCVRLALAHFLNLPLDDFQRLTASPAGISAIDLDGKKPLVWFINLTTGILPGLGK
jgi:probable phosphomutase (TIGR03848 family)